MIKSKEKRAYLPLLQERYIFDKRTRGNRIRSSTKRGLTKTSRLDYHFGAVGRLQHEPAKVHIVN